MKKMKVIIMILLLFLVGCGSKTVYRIANIVHINGIKFENQTIGSLVDFNSRNTNQTVNIGLNVELIPDENFYVLCNVDCGLLMNYTNDRTLFISCMFDRYSEYELQLYLDNVLISEINIPEDKLDHLEYTLHEEIQRRPESDPEPEKNKPVDSKKEGTVKSSRLVY